jgi:polyhydroxybutyrate depolymerase
MFSVKMCRALLMLLVVPLLVVARSAAQSGETRGSLEVDGRTRTYLLYQPAQATTPTALIIALHGGGGQSNSMVDLTDFNTLADQEGFAVVYPDGVDRQWNDGGIRADLIDTTIDDVAFISALIDELVAQNNIDPTRVYATGISNGGHMSNRLACDLADKIAAIAVVAATLWDTAPQSCSLTMPMPVLLMHGTDDPISPFEGGTIGRGRRNILSAQAAIEFWRDQNGCDTTPTTEALPDTDPNDRTTIQRATYSACDGDVQVVLYQVDGGGHAWPGGLAYARERLIGITSQDINASEVIWQYFSQWQR